MIATRMIGWSAGLLALGGTLMMARGDEVKRPAYPETPSRPASDRITASRSSIRIAGSRM